MLLIAVIDWQHLIIPNKIVFTGLIIGILLKLVLSKSVLWQSVVSSLCAFMLTLIVLAAGSWLLRKPAMGIGDVKLAAVIGLFIGIQNFLIAFWLATLLGMTFGFYKYLSSRKVDTHLSVTCNMQSTIKNAFYSDSKLPFGSFLAVSSCFVFVLSDYINQLMELWTI
jgi:prepilin signal peptidase PulO-like enzyme (type II secretory pathway)